MAKSIISIGGASKTNPADANYPQGSFKDVSAPGAGDGTPLVAEWPTQYDAFFQRVMSEAGLAYNGALDTAIASQFYDAAETIFGGGWKLLEEVTPGAVSNFQILNVPASATQVILLMSEVDYSVASRTDIAATVGGVAVAAGYKSKCVYFDGSASVSISSSDINFETNRAPNTPGTDTHEGIAVLSKVGSLNKWVYSFTGDLREDPLASYTNWAHTIGSTDVLAGPLDGLEIQSQSGNFAGGTFAAYYR